MRMTDVVSTTRGMNARVFSTPSCPVGGGGGDGKLGAR